MRLFVCRWGSFAHVSFCDVCCSWRRTMELQATYMMLRVDWPQTHCLTLSSWILSSPVHQLKIEWSSAEEPFAVCGVSGSLAWAKEGETIAPLDLHCRSEGIMSYSLSPRSLPKNFGLAWGRFTLVPAECGFDAICDMSIDSSWISARLHHPDQSYLWLVAQNAFTFIIPTNGTTCKNCRFVESNSVLTVAS